MLAVTIAAALIVVANYQQSIYSFSKEAKHVMGIKNVIDLVSASPFAMNYELQTTTEV